MKTQLTTLEQQWIQYRDACYPPDKTKLDPLQESETRQAFYAGNLLALKIVVESSAYLSEEAAFQNIKNLIKNAQTVCREHIYEMKGRN
jgi:hypothetical protein